MEKLEDFLNFKEVEDESIADIISVTGMPEQEALIAKFYEPTKLNKALIEAHMATIHLKHNQYFFVMPATMFRTVAQQIDEAFPAVKLTAKSIMYHVLITELIAYGMELFIQKSRDYLAKRNGELIEDDPVADSVSKWHKAQLKNDDFTNPDLN